MTRDQAIHRLFLIWIVIILVPVLLVTAQTISGKYGEDASIAWNWLLNQTGPVLAILLASVFSNPSKRWRSAAARRAPYLYAIAASAVQGIAILIVLLIEPMVSISAFEIFEKTSVILTLVQGVVVAAVGAVIFDGR